MTRPIPTGLVVDTSAPVAILLAEPGHDALVACLEDAALRLMSAATRVELGLVLEARLGANGAEATTRFLRDAEIQIVAVDEDAADRALGAWRRYGKGRHRAALNFGDRFTYALAEQAGFPILCTGEDFSATDMGVRPVR